MRRVALSLLLSMALFACTPDVDVSAASCVPGEQVICPCFGGVEGIQICQEDGTFGDCACEDIPPEPDATSGDGVGGGGPCEPKSARSCVTDCGSEGEEICGEDGAYGPCEAPTEGCNGEDDDCDGEIDEDLTCVPCEPGENEDCVTSCDTDGRRKCEDGYWTPCVPPAETCNGIDDDCDGISDEALSQVCINACGDGIEACINGKWVGCTAPLPALEICDGLDNDCDGTTDLAANLTPLEVLCETPCGEGSQVCEEGGWGTCSLGTEVCNGLDDDCDSEVDEGVSGGCACPEGEVQDCGSSVGICQPGEQTCVSGAWSPCGGQGFVEAGAEICDGLDNDCDGVTDEGNPGGGAACGTPNAAQGGEVTLPCQEGTIQCVGGLLECPDGLDPQPESCDGKDNDCNGVTDDKPTADAYEPNEGCETRSDVGEVVENQATKSIQGTLYPGSDVDWYEVRTKELSDACLPLTGEGTYVLTVTMQPPEGKDYDLCVWPSDEMACGDLPDEGLCMELGIWKLHGVKETYTAIWDGSCLPVWDDNRTFYIKVVTFDPDEDFDCVPYHMDISLIKTN